MLFRYKKITASFLLLAVVYIAQTILTKPDKAILAKYHINASQSVELSLTIALPYLIIWFLALLGYLRLRSYIDTIQDTKDGVALTVLGRAVLWLAFWLPITAVVTNYATHAYSVHPALTAAMVRIVVYLNLLMLLPAFILVYTGSKQLLRTVKLPPLKPGLYTTVPYICFSVLYTFLVLHDPARTVPAHGARVAAYYLADWLIIATIVIPRLLMWFLALMAVQNIYLYRKKVKGSLYKLALNNLARGISGVVLTSVVLRFLQSLSPELERLNLGALLVMVYILLIMLGVSYLLISRGAKRLQEIEEL